MIKLNIQRFGSTNKTTHYELSQFVSSDKPSWLNDINSDMSKIDTAINTAKTTADGAATAATNAQTAAETAQTTANTAVTNAATADGKAETAQTRIGTLANLTTTAKTNVVEAINEVDSNCDSNASKIGTLSSLDTTVKTDLVSAINEVAELERYSTTEEPIGTYTDGKTIYRRVISSVGTLNNTDTLLTFTLQTNVDKCINAKIFMHTNDTNKDYMLPILAITPLYDETTVDNATHVLSLDISREHQVHYSGNTLSAIIEYTKYQ